MKHAPIKALAFFCLLLCWSCDDQAGDEIVTLKVERSDFEVAVEAKGDLHAVKATPIKAPRSRGGANTISWILAEGSFVKEGEVLIRFDEATLKIREEETTSELKGLAYRRDIDSRNHGQENHSLDGKIYVLEEERQQARQFAPKDERLYTRTEIIESQVNLDFLDAKVDYFDEKKVRHDLQGKTQSEIHDLDQKTREMQLDQVRENLQNLVTRAPHDGYFYYERNWRGEPPRVGQPAWTGMQLGQLPDLSVLEAKVFVLEKEASGLKDGLTARVTLDARPGFPYKATVKTVATLAKAIERNSPVNYFEVVLSLEKTDEEHMRPGGLVEARIFIDRQEQVISLPNQVFFHGDNENWVYVRNGKDFEKRMVKLGKRGPNKTIVEEGLQEGDEVAMSDPTQEEGP